MEDFVDKEADQERKRTIELEGGNRLHIERMDPYGFWRVHYDKGQVPPKLRGLYTSLDNAKKAVNGYMNEKDLKQVSGKNAP